MTHLGPTLGLQRRPYCCARFPRTSVDMQDSMGLRRDELRSKVTSASASQHEPPTFPSAASSETMAAHASTETKTESH